MTGRPRPLPLADSVALSGVLAVLEAAIWNDAIPDRLEQQLRLKLVETGLLAGDADGRTLRQALRDMTLRVRYAAGDYDEPPADEPVLPDKDV